MNFEQWLDQLIGDDTRAQAAKKSGYSQSTITRQLSRGHIRPETVIALCRAYDRSPVTGLIETGYINEWETEGVSIPYALNKATNEQILDEIMRRSDPEARYLFTANGDDTVIDLHPDMQTDDLSQRRHVTPSAYSDSTQDDGEDLPYAADSSPDEPMPGDDDYSDGP